MPWTLKELAEKIADIDFTMLSTKSDGNVIASRPMSNNGDVEYDGDSFFFAYEDTRVVSDIKADPKIGLSLQTKGGLLGKPPVFIAIEATAQLIQDKAQFEAHWKDELERWFPQGIDTPGITLIKAHANRVTYWDGEEEAEVKL